MKKFDGDPLAPGASPTPQPKDDRTILSADATTSRPPIKNLLSAAVSEAAAGSFAHKILMSSLNGIYVHDLKTAAHTFINPQYTRLTGYTLADLQALRGAEFFALFHPQDQERLAAHLKRLFRAGGDETMEIEYRFKTADRPLDMVSVKRRCL